MKYNITTRSTCNINNKNKKSQSPQNNIASVNSKNKSPLFKIFMDNNNYKQKKLYLMRNTINTLKDNISKNKRNNNIYSKPLFIIYKILNAKYNINPKLYDEKIIFNLFFNKKCHLLASFRETLLYENTLKEYLKCLYNYNKSKDKIQKYFIYYKNYINLFCRPTFADLFVNKKIIEYNEKIAKIYCNKNYENSKKSKKLKEEYNVQIFSNKIIEDIENGDKFTVVNSENSNKEIKIMVNKMDKNNNDNLFDNGLSTITFSLFDKNSQQSSNYLNFSNEQNKYHINSSKDTKNILKNNDDSIDSLINEIKENEINNEKISKKAGSNISPEIQNIIELKMTKKIHTFKNTDNIMHLSKKYEENKNTSLGQHNINKNKKLNENSNENKRMINNLNININNLIINHKIITSTHDKAKNREYKQLFFNSKEDNQEANNKIINEIKSILKIDNKNRINILESKDYNNSNKNIFKKDIFHLKAIKQGSSNNIDNINKKLNRVNSMIKISTLTINTNKIKQRNIHNLNTRKMNKNNSLLRLGGGILDNQGKIILQHNISGDSGEIENYNKNGQNIIKNFNITKISALSNRSKKTSNNNSISNNKNYCFNYIINSDREVKKRSISNINKRKKIFNSDFNLNLSNNDRKNFRPLLYSPNNSKIKEKIENDNSKYKNEKKRAYKNENNTLFSNKRTKQKIFDKKIFIEHKKMKLKNVRYIDAEKKLKNLNLLSPKKNTFRSSSLIKNNYKLMQKLYN